MAGKGGGGGWKVAYADFVTAMMAFFMVMWLVGQKPDVKDSIAGYFHDPFASGGGGAATGDVGHESPRAPAHGPKQHAPKRGDTPPKPPAEGGSAKKLTLRLQGAGSHTSVGTTVPFGPCSAEITAPAQAALDQILPALLGRPQKIELRGHASRRPLPKDSGFADAWQLSYARCQATRKYLEEHGVEPGRMRLSQAGTYETVGGADDEDFLVKQERVDVRLLTETTLDWQPKTPESRVSQPSKDDHHAATPPAAAAAHGHGH